MEMNFDFQGDECAEVMEAIARRMQALTQQPATRETHACIQRLQRFAKKMGPIIVQCKAEASDEIGRLN